MMKTIMRAGLAAAALGLIAGGAGRASAGMTLTAAGSADGLTLSTFASGFPSSGVGPLGVAVTSAGNVLVVDAANGRIYNFASDTDGQTAGAVTSQANSAFGLTNDNGTIYATASGIVALNNDGSTNHTVTSSVGGFGIAANPVTHDLYVADGSGITIVNPTTGTSNRLLSSGFLDGIAVSNDGKTVYATDESSKVFGFDATTGVQVFSATVTGGPDGVAIGTGSLAGNLFVNTNDGRVVEINLATSLQTVLASGGSRGDFVAVDPNGSLLLTQSDSVLRLTPANGGFGPVAPEPSTLISGGIAGLVGLGCAWRHRKARPAS